MSFRLDRTEFRIQAIQAKNATGYWYSRTSQEHFAAAWYLTRCAYHPPYTLGQGLKKNALPLREQDE